MELRQLRYFVAIADCGSFSRAAEQVFVAQSALSHQMAQLEDELGAVLFHRSRRGTGLTEAGERFHAHAVSILRQTQEAVDSVRNASRQPTGKVVFGLPHSVSHALALPLLRTVRQALPGVQLELSEELTGHLIQRLRIGQIQLAVLFDDGALSEFACTPVLHEALALIEPAPGTVCGASVTLRQALRRPLILPAHPHGVRPIVEAAAQRAGCAPLRVEADISSISILRTSLLAGMGSTLLPVMPLRTEIESGQLKATPVLEPALERTVTLCAPTHLPSSEATRAVAQRAVQLMRELCSDGQWLGARLVSPDLAGP